MRGVAGLSERELARVRGRLVEFSEEMFASMRRKDQRRWGEVYLLSGCVVCGPTGGSAISSPAAAM